MCVCVCVHVGNRPRKESTGEGIIAENNLHHTTSSHYYCSASWDVRCKQFELI